MQCPKCRKNVPDSSKFCPGCGFNLEDVPQEKHSGKVLVIAICVLAAIVAVLVGYILGSRGKDPAEEKPVSVSAESNTSAKVEEKAEKSPAEAKSEESKKTSEVKTEDVPKQTEEERKAELYEQACKAAGDGSYAKAVGLFAELGDYLDSVSRLADAQQELDYTDAMAALNRGDYDAAVTGFTKLGQFKNSAEQLEVARSMQQHGEWIDKCNAAGVEVPEDGSWLSSPKSKRVKQDTNGIYLRDSTLVTKYASELKPHLITTLPKGEKVTVLAVQGRYSLVEAASTGQVGWVTSSNIG